MKRHDRVIASLALIFRVLQARPLGAQIEGPVKTKSGNDMGETHGSGSGSRK